MLRLICQADMSGHSSTPLSILCRSQCGQVSRGMPYLNTNIALLQPLHVDSLISSPVASSLDNSNSSSNSIVEFGIQVRNASNVSHSRSAISSRATAVSAGFSEWAGSASNATQRETIAAASLRAQGVERKARKDRGGGPRRRESTGTHQRLRKVASRLRVKCV